MIWQKKVLEGMFVLWDKYDLVPVNIFFLKHGLYKYLEICF